MNLSQADIRNPDPEYALTIFTLPGIFCAAFTVTDITIQNSIKKTPVKIAENFFFLLAPYLLIFFTDENAL